MAKVRDMLNKILPADAEKDKMAAPSTPAATEPEEQTQKEEQKESGAELSKPFYERFNMPEGTIFIGALDAPVVHDARKLVTTEQLIDVARGWHVFAHAVSPNAALGKCAHDLHFWFKEPSPEDNHIKAYFRGGRVEQLPRANEYPRGQKKP